MEIAYINELTEESDAMFMCADKREYLYEDIQFIPASTQTPIIWEDKDSHSEAVFDITSSGDLSVSALIAQVVMSFDPYGVTVLPNKLDCMDGLSKPKRYILAINNELDVVDFAKSGIEECTTYYDPEIHGYDVPLEDQKPITSLIIYELFLDKDKLKSYPKNHRHAFRVKGTNCLFFSAEVYDEVWKLGLAGLVGGLSAFKFDINQQAPTR